jgi:hypothetical protein
MLEEAKPRTSSSDSQTERIAQIISNYGIRKPHNLSINNSLGFSTYAAIQWSSTTHQHNKEEKARAEYQKSRASF